MDSISEAKYSDNTEKRFFIYSAPKTETGEANGTVACAMTVYL